MKGKKKVHFEIDNGKEFFADEVGVIHNPLRIIFDFRNVTPRVDMRNKDFQPLVLRHNVVLMDPYTAKSFADVLQKSLENYEEQFGEIKKPKQIKKMEDMNKDAEIKTSNIEETPSYFG